MRVIIVILDLNKEHFEVICAQNMCIIVGFQKLIIYGRDADVVGW